jgi:hypothetical protein
MKVYELINLLKDYEPDLEVVVSGYEGGYNNVAGISELILLENYNKGRSWVGAHESLGWWNNEDEHNYNKFNAVTIF